MSPSPVWKKAFYYRQCSYLTPLLWQWPCEESRLFSTPSWSWWAPFSTASSLCGWPTPETVLCHRPTGCGAQSAAVSDSIGECCECHSKWVALWWAWCVHVCSRPVEWIPGTFVDLSQCYHATWTLGLLLLHQSSLGLWSFSTMQWQMLHFHFCVLLLLPITVLPIILYIALFCEAKKATKNAAT